jgi:hypothetical protein
MDSKERVVSEAEGQHLLRSFQNGPLYVRVHPKRPDKSVLNPYRDVRPDPATVLPKE